MRMSLMAVLAGAGACVSTGTALDDRELPRAAAMADEILIGFPEPAPDRVVAVGDLDGDGVDELVAYGTAGHHATVLGATRWTIAFDGPVMVAPAGDVDGDGRDDLAIGVVARCEIRILYGGERETAAAITEACGAMGTGVGDLDGDGRADLIVAPLPGGPRVFHGRPARQPRNVGEADAVLQMAPGERDVGYWVAPAGDPDGDGRADFLVTTHDSTLLYGGERFAGIVEPARVAHRFVEADIGPHEPAGVGDLDGDGRDDLVINAHAALYTIRYGRDRGDGSYGGADASLLGGDAIATTPAIVSGDLDGDGALDLAVADPEMRLAAATGADGAVFVLRGTGTRRTGNVELLDEAEIWLGRVTSLAIADLDGDGRAELAAAAPADGAVYLRRGR